MQITVKKSLHVLCRNKMLSEVRGCSSSAGAKTISRDQSHQKQKDSIDILQQFNFPLGISKVYLNTI